MSYCQVPDIALFLVNVIVVYINYCELGWNEWMPDYQGTRAT